MKKRNRKTEHDRKPKSIHIQKTTENMYGRIIVLASETHNMYSAVGVFPSHRNNARAHSMPPRYLFANWISSYELYQHIETERKIFRWQNTTPFSIACACVCLRTRAWAHFRVECTIVACVERRKHEMRYAMCVTSIHSVLPMHEHTHTHTKSNDNDCVMMSMVATFYRECNLQQNPLIQSTPAKNVATHIDLTTKWNEMNERNEK